MRAIRWFFCHFAYIFVLLFSLLFDRWLQRSGNRMFLLHRKGFDCSVMVERRYGQRFVSKQRIAHTGRSSYSHNRIFQSVQSLRQWMRGARVWIFFNSVVFERWTNEQILYGWKFVRLRWAFSCVVLRHIAAMQIFFVCFRCCCMFLSVSVSFPLSRVIFIFSLPWCRWFWLYCARALVRNAKILRFFFLLSCLIECRWIHLLVASWQFFGATDAMTRQRHQPNQTTTATLELLRLLCWIKNANRRRFSMNLDTKTATAWEYKKKWCSEPEETCAMASPADDMPSKTMRKK